MTKIKVFSVLSLSIWRANFSSIFGALNPKIMYYNPKVYQSWMIISKLLISFLPLHTVWYKAGCLSFFTFYILRPLLCWTGIMVPRYYQWSFPCGYSISLNVHSSCLSKNCTIFLSILFESFAITPFGRMVCYFLLSDCFSLTAIAIFLFLLLLINYYRHLNGVTVLTNVLLKMSLSENKKIITTRK